MLKQLGDDHNFLVRPSKSKMGDYTLSVRVGNDVTHIKIQNTGNFYDLYGGQKFSTLTELVDYYIKNPGQLRERNGQEIKLGNPLPAADPATERWFHGDLKGIDAERLLLDEGHDGSYLVRASQSNPGDFCLSVRCGKKVSHIVIRNKGGNYDIGGGDSFCDLASLVKHYSLNPMVEVSGTIVALKRPLNGTRISLSSLRGRIAELAKETDAIYGRAGFSEEFDTLQQSESRENKNKTKFEGQRPENKMKNRHRGILPFDETRIVLRDVNPRAVGADYINANLVRSPSLRASPGYIATQAPMPETVNEFWQMVYEKQCAIIVMATNLMERNKVRCHKYWPDQDQRVEYGKLRVTGIAELHVQTNDQGYIFREFELEHPSMNESWKVFQFHYTTWPDQGVPSNPSHVLHFLMDIHECTENTTSVKGPIVVHCGAGIGRTGTLIAIDEITQKIVEHETMTEIDIAQTILNLRAQRPGLVQTEQQYKFVYQTVLYHVENWSQQHNAYVSQWDDANQDAYPEGHMYGQDLPVRQGHGYGHDQPVPGGQASSNALYSNINSKGNQDLYQNLN